MTRLLLLLVALGTALPPGGAQQPAKPPTNRNVRFGMPGEAKADPDSRDAYLIDRPQYVLSYSDKRKTANWACWLLVKGTSARWPAGRSSRTRACRRGSTKSGSGAYTGSGFDRGHLCPSKDRSDTEENNDATFLMTNVIPQSPACNRGAWEKFERYCRDLAFDGKEVYLAAGPHGVGGVAADGTRKLTVGRNAPFVTVPMACGRWRWWWTAGPTRRRTSRTIAVWMPNDDTVKEDDWASYRVPVAEVETRTKLKFFPLVPDEVAAG
jgi:endonuclease G